MNPAPPRTPAERLAILVRYLLQTINVLYLGGPQGGRVPRPLLALINQRMQNFRDRFARLASRIAAGTYRPRRHTPRQTPVVPRPWRESPLRKQGWLADLLPNSVAAPLRGNLNAFLEDAATKALIEAAPAPMARLLRPVCWMLKFKPPPALASPRRPAGTPPPTPKPYVPPPPPPPPIPAPANTLGLHPIQIDPRYAPRHGPPLPGKT